MNRLLVFITIVLFSFNLNAKNKDRVDGEIIVKFSGAFNPMKIQKSLSYHQYKIKDVISSSLNLYLVEVTDSIESAKKKLKEDSATLYVQSNHYVQQRSLPNDPQINQTWNMLENSVAGISANLVWNTNVGGVDKGGNDIVVAVIDGGIDVKHPDLKENIWINKNETPGNGIDDDKNGYVDDIYGWNAYGNNGAISADQHATHVAGIIGAVGNNGIGISGVNGNVKVLSVMGSSSTTATIAKAYGYVIEQKKLWFSSQRKMGANIVATNSSFGVDNANCASGEYPIWNDLYENMGKLGILSAAATANNDVDVDRSGDVPTGCSSEYIVTVTNTNNTNAKYPSAGYGLKTIDLGAPGTSILSTLPNSSYGKLTGTSMATPHVAGAVALLHSVASVNFYNQYMEDPAAAALNLKSILLKGVDPLPSLKGATVTGGRLNVFKSSQLMSNYMK